MIETPRTPMPSLIEHESIDVKHIEEEENDEINKDEITK
jgi:hypothetical protein